MKQVGAFEARNRFGTLLDWVEHGEEVVITRRGRIVARLIPAASAFDADGPAVAVAAIIGRRKGVALAPISIKDLVDEGRS